ncbi:MAG: winged helix-turn-helix transcriptional regulator [Candidatus Lokiarchaeota archaeon]|nr:winged helix-turn-helix transcriptional regulator [Candidatus Lokiarchaeota archaeon]
MSEKNKIVISLSQKSRKVVRNVTIAFLVAVSMATFPNSGRCQKDFSDDEVLSQKTRCDIYTLIEENEGIHFRQICRKLNKKMGVVQYHISVLEKNKYIHYIKDGRYKCFFATKPNGTFKSHQTLPYEERQTREHIIAAMKRNTPNKIIRYLNENDEASHQELAEICKVSPQAITFHCQRLTELDLIGSKKVGRRKFYLLPEEIQKLMAYI